MVGVSFALHGWELWGGKCWVSQDTSSAWTGDAEDRESVLTAGDPGPSPLPGDCTPPTRRRWGRQ